MKRVQKVKEVCVCVGWEGGGGEDGGGRGEVSSEKRSVGEVGLNM